MILTPRDIGMLCLILACFVLYLELMFNWLGVFKKERVAKSYIILGLEEKEKEVVIE